MCRCMCDDRSGCWWHSLPLACIDSSRFWNNGPRCVPTLSCKRSTSWKRATPTQTSPLKKGGKENLTRGYRRCGGVHNASATTDPHNGPSAPCRLGEQQAVHTDFRRATGWRHERGAWNHLARPRHGHQHQWYGTFYGVCCFSQLLCACTILASDRFISAPPFSRKLLGLCPWWRSFCVWPRRSHIQRHQSVHRSEVGGFFFLFLFFFEAIQGTCFVASFLVYGV